MFVAAVLVYWCVRVVHVAEPMLGFARGCSRQSLETQSKQASYPLAQRGLLPQMTAYKKTSTPKALCACLCECVCMFATEVS